MAHWKAVLALHFAKQTPKQKVLGRHPMDKTVDVNKFSRLADL